MSINLLQAIQQNLGYPPLQKIDPNTQEVIVDSSTPDEERFSQAAIPSVLMALYTYSTTDEGAENIRKGDSHSGWINTLFGDFAHDAIQRIASYSGQPAQAIPGKINKIAAQAIHEILQYITPNGTALDVKTLLADQRSLALPYLPASMQMGILLNNPTLDDRTNKMEGPVSNLIHAIGNIFSGSDTEIEKSK